MLAALDRREMTRLNEFVHSPYFNKHKPTRRLCAYLSGLHPHFAEKKLKKELVITGAAQLLTPLKNAKKSHYQQKHQKKGKW